MRITAGKAKGHQLHIPTIPNLRPTKSMVRQAIFSILAPILPQARVLDLFAGSGSLGIEALSRGAEKVDFVDINPRACEAIRLNLQHTRFLGRGRIFCQSAEDFLRSAPPAQYHLILADPPYDLAIEHLLIKAAPKLKTNGILVYLHARKKVFPPLAGLQWEETRHYGITGVSFFSRPAPPPTG